MALSGSVFEIWHVTDRQTSAPFHDMATHSGPHNNTKLENYSMDELAGFACSHRVCFIVCAVHQFWKLSVCRWCSVQSCENRIVLWKPGSHTSELQSLGSKPSPAEGTTVSILHQFDFASCDIWFMRFAMDHRQKVCILLVAAIRQFF